MLWIVIRQVLPLLGMGVAIGIPVALEASQLVSSMLFGVKAPTHGRSAQPPSRLSPPGWWLPSCRPGGIARRSDGSFAIRIRGLLRPQFAEADIHRERGL
jgi:hypothetical protein